MKIAFVTNVINTHQSFLADEFWRITNGQYTYITVECPTEDLKYKMSTTNDEYQKPYLIQAWQSEEERQRGIRSMIDADVVIIGGSIAVIPYEEIRVKTGKLTFGVGERIMKRGILNIFSKAAREYSALYRRLNKPQNLYYLCASAYTANDIYLLHPFFRGRCFKWCYFTKVPQLDIDNIILKRRLNKHVKLLWVSCFINLKMPEIAIKMVKTLKDEGYDIELNMVGMGILENKMKNLIQKLGLRPCVHMLGRLSNDQVYEQMQKHDIFLFTSNKREGWGAVLNEAMSCGCACVVSELIGAAPFLIHDSINGLLFKTGSVEDLVIKVKYLIDHPMKREQICKEAYHTMSLVWNSRVGAANFYKLSESIISKQPITIGEGPCSLAVPIEGKTFSK